jgi:hypothetical protein
MKSVAFPVSRHWMSAFTLLERLEKRCCAGAWYAAMDICLQVHIYCSLHASQPEYNESQQDALLSLFFTLLCHQIISHLSITLCSSRRISSLAAKASSGNQLSDKCNKPRCVEDMLKMYVCPPCANAVRRQIDMKRPEQ